MTLLFWRHTTWFIGAALAPGAEFRCCSGACCPLGEKLPMFGRWWKKLERTSSIPAIGW